MNVTHTPKCNVKVPSEKKKKKKYKLLMQLGSSCLWDGHSRTHIRLQLSQVESRSVTRPFESSATTSNGGTFIRFPSESTSN